MNHLKIYCPYESYYFNLKSNVTVVLRYYYHYFSFVTNSISQVVIIYKQIECLMDDVKELKYFCSSGDSGDGGSDNNAD